MRIESTKEGVMDQAARGVLFEEEQHFRQWWLWAVIGSLDFLALAVFGYGLVKQLILGRPWGNNPMPDWLLIVFSAVMFGLILGVTWLLWKLCLRVTVDRTHLRIRFFPLAKREIPVDMIARHEPRTYAPIREYGGWGVRWGFGRRGMAYNVSGSRGVQIELADGKRILIGSQRPEDLDRALGRARGGRGARGTDRVRG
ncbi:MAG: hypothetical protein KJ621_03400, partial [Proteobacteria bacterium]|nr:hypothetical protein [Pseudomonadota bacterium]MBU1742629.1 hypothetical protein [Pseudomonadota bacterium]